MNERVDIVAKALRAEWPHLPEHAARRAALVAIDALDEGGWFESAGPCGSYSCSLLPRIGDAR